MMLCMRQKPAPDNRHGWGWGGGAGLSEPISAAPGTQIDCSPNERLNLFFNVLMQDRSC